MGKGKPLSEIPQEVIGMFATKVLDLNNDNQLRFQLKTRPGRTRLRPDVLGMTQSILTMGSRKLSAGGIKERVEDLDILVFEL